MGEDARLAGALGAAAVAGLTDGRRLNSTRAVAPLLKHFAAYSTPEGGHNAAPARIGRREPARARSRDARAAAGDEAEAPSAPPPQARAALDVPAAVRRRVRRGRAGGAVSGRRARGVAPRARAASARRDRAVVV